MKNIILELQYYQCALCSLPHAYPQHIAKKQITKEHCSLIFGLIHLLDSLLSRLFFVWVGLSKEESAIYGASISLHISYHPRVSSTMCWQPPGLPLVETLKESSV